MRLPRLTPQRTSVGQVDVFQGMNHNLRINDGEFYEMVNLTSDRYPQMASRKPRGFHAYKAVEGMIAKDHLCYVSDGTFYINDFPVTDFQLRTGEKQLVSMGAYVIIMPDRAWVNTLNPSDHGFIDAEYDATGTGVTMTVAQRDGTDQQIKTISTEAPSNPSNMDLWLDISGEKHVLKMWSSTTSMWVSVATTYVKISAPGIGTQFEQYDGINLEGLSAAADLDDRRTDVAALDGAAVVWDKGDNWITVVGLIDRIFAMPDDFSFKVTRKMPEMDFIVEHNNRLWGCRYGLNAKGDVVNELYACKLGDFKNWTCFMGISTDSYAVSLGSDGPFTGAITHGNYPIFFKEGCMHKVYGQIPANFQVQTMACRGVQKGSSSSLAIVNEVLYYKSNDGVCAYDGSLPVEVSSQFGDLRYKDVIACGHENKYYASMVNAAGERELMVYDTTKGMWHRENDPGIRCMCSCKGVLYAGLDETIITLAGAPGDENVEWSAITGLIGALTPEDKYLQRIAIRMILDSGSKVEILAQYDSIGPWESLASLRGKDMRSFAFTIRPVRCDHLRLKFVGTGTCIVYAIAQHMVMGSDMHDRD